MQIARSSSLAPLVEKAESASSNHTGDHGGRGGLSDPGAAT